MTTTKKKKKTNKPRRATKHPEPAPEGRQKPHHDGRAFDPTGQREYRDHDKRAFDPHQSECVGGL